MFVRRDESWLTKKRMQRFGTRRYMNEERGEKREGEREKWVKSIEKMQPLFKSTTGRKQPGTFPGKEHISYQPYSRKAHPALM